MIITIDTGTTNTRVKLWDSGVLVDVVKSNIGVRNTSIDGNNQQLIHAISSALHEIKEKHHLRDNDIEAILAAGMITSNLGLKEVPHLVAPVSLKDFEQNVVKAHFPEISEKEICFIPGVKNVSTDEGNNLRGLDIMRGEEVEALAIACHYDIDENIIIALPGSHSKFVGVAEDNAITGCCTTIAGELTSIITHQTILASSLQSRFTDDINEESLLEGYKEAEQFGFGKALFSIRLLEQFGKQSHEQLASFLLGVILHSDIEAMCNVECLNFKSTTSVYIGGRGTYATATEIILKNKFPTNPVIHCKHLEHLSSEGSMYIARAAGIIT